MIPRIEALLLIKVFVYPSQLGKGTGRVQWHRKIARCILAKILVALPQKHKIKCHKKARWLIE